MKTMRSVAMATASACALAFAAPAAIAQPAQQADDLQQFEFDIPAQPLPDALMSLSEQSKQTVLASPLLTEGRQSEAVSGAYTMPQALAKILRSSGLKYKQQDARTWLITAQLAEAMGVTSSDVAMNDAGDDPRLIRVAQVSEQDEEEQRDEEEEEKRPRDEIIVTGTNIRGIAPESSPTRTFTREDIQISGAGTAQDFIETLTTNFGGGSNADLAFGLPNDANSGQNSGAQGSLGSSVNLRGLGSGSTLVLLNGHRLAPSSGIGDFTDISVIPASAIERVEVLTDGASSIYGSDAVAGVTNFILRDDFEGVEATFRYGIATQHRSAEEFRAGITGGLNWERGHALVAYEYFNQDQIGAQDRSFSQSALLPNNLTPSQERHSVLGSISQDLTSNLEAFADVTFSRRVAVQDATTFTGDIFRDTPKAKNLNISAGGTWKVSDSWFADFSSTFSDVDIIAEQTGLTPVRADINSRIWVSDIILSGPVFSLPGGDVKLAFGGHFRHENFLNFNVGQDRIANKANRDVYAAFGEVFIPVVGPDNAIPGIERLELNISGRFDDYSDFGTTTNPKVGVLWSPLEAFRLRGSYSTSFNPPALGRVGATDLSALALETSFIFPIFGLTPADPSIADVVFLSVSGTSKALDAEHSRAFTAGMDFDKRWHQHKLALSATWFDINFENRLGRTPIPGNVVSFDVPNIAFNNPDAFPEGTVIFFPSADQIGDVLDSVDNVVANRPPALGNPFEAKIISFAGVIRNLGVTLVSGFDFHALYTYESGFGDITFGIDGTYLNEFKQQAAITTPAIEQVNTLHNPVDFRLRGRAGYGHNGLAANVFVNYVNDYLVDNTADAMRIDSWTTVDLSLSYDIRDRVGHSILDDTVFRLSIVNLFDVDPPSTPNNPTFGIFGYDPTNASALGRFVSIELTKKF